MHWLPESPRIIAARGQREEARAILRQVYSGATEEVLDLKLRIIDVTIREMSKLNNQYTFKQRCKVLWTHKPYRRAIIAVSGMQAFGQLTGYNSLLYYSGTLFGLLGFSNAAIAGLIPSGGNALCVVSWRRFPRSPLLVNDALIHCDCAGSLVPWKCYRRQGRTKTSGLDRRSFPYRGTDLGRHRLSLYVTVPFSARSPPTCYSHAIAVQI
jgi:hypothetical protein